MQTFLPYADFDECARVLDPKRLGNQFYREGLTLIRGKWPNHPASKMWCDHRYALGMYLVACAGELIRRGHWTPNFPKQIDEVWNIILAAPHRAIPKWLGDERLHSSHRANLLRKNPDHYSQFGWAEEPAEGYYWPA